MVSGIVLFQWLSDFKPGIPDFPVAQVRITPSSQLLYKYVVLQESEESASTYIFSRSTLTSSTHLDTPATVLSATSQAIFVTFDKIILPDALVPIGFRSVFRLAKVTNAAGEVLFEQKKAIFEQFIPLEQVSFSFLATEQEQTYTITVQDTDLMVIK
jgi:hypothetical protein